MELAPLHADPRLRAQLKPEAVWEDEHGLAVSALDPSDAPAVRDAWYATVLELFTRSDALLAPSTQVFPFPADVRWPGEIDGRPRGQLPAGERRLLGLAGAYEQVTR
ncbi:hypothetical protein [Pseudonocardia sp. GCM10023141]|uniref:hypothetical protein n=1 Tax=Pseudonocardia sp. GCM10023141 TaxID=3252653 RepID=UPI0036071B7D